MTATQATETVESNPVGRPTAYKPEYCDVVIELGKQGYSNAEMAAHFGVAKQTFSQWKGVYPEFADAVTRADALAQSWWEGKAREGLGSNQFNANLFKIIAYNRFRDDYADRKEVKIDANHQVQHSVLSGLAGQLEHGTVVDVQAIEVQDGEDDQ